MKEYDHEYEWMIVSRRLKHYHMSFILDWVLERYASDLGFATIDDLKEYHDDYLRLGDVVFDRGVSCRQN